MFRFIKTRQVKTLFLSRKKITIITTALLIIAIFYIVNNPAIVGASATSRQLPIYSVQRDNRAVSLTINAALGNEDTEQLIEILSKYGIKATFFVVGEWVDRYSESVKALHDAGHEIMNHSDDYAHFSKLSSEEIVKNVTACNEKIYAVTGVMPTLFRATYGEYDDNVVWTVSFIGMYTIQWDVDSLDRNGLSAAEIAERVRDGVSPGSIILLQSGVKNMPEALIKVIESLMAERYSIIPVSELLLKGEYTIDHKGRQRPN